MSDLLLHEAVVVAELDQVGDIGVPEAMGVELSRQADLVTDVGDAAVHVADRQPAATTGPDATGTRDRW